jgi:uncharacterized protein
MNERPRILDAEAHVAEPADLWSRYLEPAFRDRVTVGRGGEEPRPKLDLEARARIELAAGRSGASADAVIEALERPRYQPWDLEVDGQPLLDPLGRALWERLSPESFRPYVLQGLTGFSAASHREELRKHGVEAAFLYPTAGLALLSLGDLDPRFGGALARAYNDWLRDFCAADPELLRGVGAVFRGDPAGMVAEVERVASWGWKAVTLRAVPVGGRLLSDPAYEPFWARCEALGVAVGLHEIPNSRTPAGGEERFRTRFARATCAHPVEQMLGLLALMEGGVLERHPDLRVGILESGCGWLPAWLWRMDASFEDNAGELRDRLTVKPSDLVRRQCFITCEAAEPGLELVIDAVGAGCVLFGSDYPHPDHPPRFERDAALLAERLSPATAAQVLWDNGCRFYGLAGAN